MNSSQIIIADSGSTKTEWILIEDKQVIASISTVGMNPYFINENEIIALFEKEIIHRININECNNLFFYGAGCGSEQGKSIIQNALSKLLKKTTVHIETDLLGAARSVCNAKEGIAAILGTGSNSCYFDGKVIVENTPSLGFILGDEGSGAHLGKTLITAILSQQAPSEINNLFYEKIKLSKQEILKSIYKKPFPNRFLASFSTFIFQNRTHPFIETLINSCFEMFFEKYICRYSNTNNNEIGFIGSIAFYFKEYLETIANAKNLRITTIQKSPIEGLIKFHLTGVL